MPEHERRRIGVSSLFLNPQYAGGIGAYLYNLMRELPRADAESDYLLYASRESAGAFDLGASNARLIPCPVDARRQPLRLAYEYGPFPFQLRRDGIDLLFSPAYTLPARRQYASVVTIHDMRHEEMPETLAPAYRIALSRLARRAARTATRVIADSEYVRRSVVARYGVPAERVIAIHLAADPVFSRSVCAGAIARVRSLYGIRAPYLFAIAAPGPQKNLATLVAAFAALREVAKTPLQLVISGLRPDDLAIVRRAWAGSRDIVPTGWVPGADLPALYQGAAAFCFPSRYEGFGIPVVEAMASGVPVVTTTATALPEVAGDAALLVEPGDVAGMAAALGRAMTDERLRGELIGRGRERAARFTWRRTAEATRDVFRDALHARRHPGGGA